MPKSLILNSERFVINVSNCLKGKCSNTSWFSVVELSCMFKWKYQLVFDSDIDFSTFSILEFGRNVTLSVIDMMCRFGVATIVNLNKLSILCVIIRYIYGVTDNNFQKSVWLYVHAWLLNLIFFYLLKCSAYNHCFLYQSRGNHPNDNTFKLYLTL